MSYPVSKQWPGVAFDPEANRGKGGFVAVATTAEPEPQTPSVDVPAAIKDSDILAEFPDLYDNRLPPFAHDGMVESYLEHINEAVSRLTAKVSYQTYQIHTKTRGAQARLDAMYTENCSQHKAEMVNMYNNGMSILQSLLSEYASKRDRLAGLRLQSAFHTAKKETDDKNEQPEVPPAHPQPVVADPESYTPPAPEDKTDEVPVPSAARSSCDGTGW